MNTKIIQSCVEVHEFARVFVGLEEFCGDYASCNQRVYGLIYEDETLLFDDLSGIRNYSCNPNYFDPVRFFNDRLLVQFIGEEYNVSNSMGPEPRLRGEFIAGFLTQLADPDQLIHCETTGEHVSFDLPLDGLPEFRQHLDALLHKLSNITFITEEPDNN